MVIPANPGAPGTDSKMIKDDVVGILANGVLLDSHKQTWSYDSCNGHSDTKGQYHYHIAPSCFLAEMMGATNSAASDSWWINDQGTAVRSHDDMAAQFPSTGSPSPVVGWSLDGYPIYALYDAEDGTLQRSAGFGGAVDECNGKLDSQGNYGYYITADPPFAPPCLKGEAVGYFSYHTTDKRCPADGIQNKVLTPAAAGACAAADGSFTSLANCSPATGTGPDATASPSAAAGNNNNSKFRLSASAVAVGAVFFSLFY